MHYCMLSHNPTLPGSEQSLLLEQIETSQFVNVNVKEMKQCFSTSYKMWQHVLNETVYIALTNILSKLNIRFSRMSK